MSAPHRLTYLASVVALLCASGPVCASPAPPTLKVDRTIGKVAGWSIGYSTQMNGCVAAASYQDHTTFWFGLQGSTDHRFVAFTNPIWHAIEPGRTYTLAVHTRTRHWQGTFVGFDRNGDHGLYQSDLKDSFVSDIYNSDVLSIDFGGRRIADLSLVGSTDAMQAVVGCQKDPETVANASSGDKSSRGGGENKRADKSSQGTGFYVSEEGHVLTNNHVIDGCSEITVTHIGSPAVKARLVAADSTNDLAVLNTGETPAAVPPLSMRARIGETVFAYGFPLNGLLATTGNFTVGNVTATEGLGDDTRHIQISAPVQPGNSGGPLVDQYGNVVGVVVSKLNALHVASITSDLAQNVNFAIKSTIALNFLEANNISPPIGDRTTEPMNSEAVAERAKLFTVRVDCH